MYKSQNQPKAINNNTKKIKGIYINYAPKVREGWELIKVWRLAAVAPTVATPLALVCTFCQNEES